ncbi:MAG: T9SS type A sorting domain-containing protein [Bacteroidota bacterium]|nr:T9SS type A sorting domain-containing protein [Bacteroidota bacterium]
MNYKRFVVIAAVMLPSFVIAQESNTYKWMTVGSLHNLFSNYGSEIETGRTGKTADQADGLRWPALYRTQDMQAAKAIWIGTTNYTDAKGTFVHKIVHVGPRPTAGSYAGETFPVLFKMTSKYDPPLVYVDGVQTYNTLVENDDVDPTMKWDRMIDNVDNTPIGLTMHRKIIAFGQPYHDNYIVYDYTFTNTGLIDDKGTKRANATLNNVYVYFLNRYGINRDVQPVIGDPVAYGKNLVTDFRGDTTNPGPAKYFSTNTDNNDLRVGFAWHGYYPGFTGGYDNIGGPIFKQATGHVAGDTVGRLGAYQFVGWATLHADKSPSDTSDDTKQPSTTSYEGSDGQYVSAGSIDQYNPAAMDGQWAMITKGHVIPRHADLLTPTTGDPSLGNSGGQSMAVGYGPYTIAPSESIHIVVAELAAGLSRDASIQIGRAFKASSSAPITFNGVTKSKNDWVFTGKDSLFQSVRRALANYQSGWNISQPPPPPTTVNIFSRANKIHMEWLVPNDPKIDGWEIWRASAQYDSTYYKIWEGPASATSYDDTLGRFDVAYYYYIASIGKASDNTGVGNTPLGRLTSSRYYTQTYTPAYRRLGASLALVKSNIRIVPNPYNLGADARNLLFPGQQDKIVFKNIPGICTIKIYSELGELIKTLDHTNETGSQDYNLTTSSNQIIVSGIYIAVIETPKGERSIHKFVVIR